MHNKTDFRIWAKSIRKTLALPNVSANIINKIRQNVIYKNAKNVMLFYPTEFEINLLTLLEDDKNFFLPRVDENMLLVCPFIKGDLLKISSFNIKEPCANPVSAKILDLVIVPALVVDKNNHRLGYGGGFYDRFLAQNKIITIVPIAEQLVVEKLPIDVFDISVDFVITD